ncbi:MAG TPA: hypothetical protein DHP27_01150 [Parabacteroides distasonis]|nr:hypothetical protein [Parabacteroides distasonis]HCX35204.1 hypothetical protein [Parabacteroides distasonis]
MKINFKFNDMKKIIIDGVTCYKYLSPMTEVFNFIRNDKILDVHFSFEQISNILIQEGKQMEIQVCVKIGEEINVRSVGYYVDISCISLETYPVFEKLAIRFFNECITNIGLNTNTINKSRDDMISKLKEQLNIQES